MAGTHVHLHVTIKEVREKQVPALDDELAKDTGEADTLDGLRTKVRERLAETDKTRIKREMERRADQGAGQAQRVPDRAGAGRPLRRRRSSTAPRASS